MESSRKYAINDTGLQGYPKGTPNKDTFNADVKIDPLEGLDTDIPFTVPRNRFPEEDEGVSSININPAARVVNALEYRGIADFFEIDPDLVYHPAPRTQVAPSAGFPDSDVLYVDKEGAHMDTLRDDNYYAVQGNAHTFDVEEETGQKADVIVYYDATNVDLEKATEGNLADDGWIISDERYQTAADVLDDLEMEAKVRFSDEGLVEIDAQNLDWYSEPVESAQEFERRHPELYNAKREEVDERVGENIALIEGMEELQRIEAMGRLENIARNERRMEDEDGLAESKRYYRDQIENPEIALPPKKYGENLTVFRRNS